jgi:hypothetical protein
MFQHFLSSPIPFILIGSCLLDTRSFGYKRLFVLHPLFSLILPIIFFLFQKPLIKLYSYHHVVDVIVAAVALSLEKGGDKGD